MFFENAFHNFRFRANDRLKANIKGTSNENSRTERVSSRLNFNHDSNNENLSMQ